MDPGAEDKSLELNKHKEEGSNHSSSDSIESIGIGLMFDDETSVINEEVNISNDVSTLSVPHDGRHGRISPSFNSIPVGHVSILSKSWSRKWGDDEGLDLDGVGVEVGRRDEYGVYDVIELQEQVQFQSHLLQEAEEENQLLKERIAKIEEMNSKILDDLNAKSHARETTIANLRECLKESNVQNNQLMDSNFELETRNEDLIQSLESKTKEVESLEQKEKRWKEMYNLLEEEYERLKDEFCKTCNDLSEHQSIVKDLRNQAIPSQSIKKKMESLDKEVGLLRNKLQKSIRANPKRSSSLFSFRTSTQKRKWKKVQGDIEEGSPAKVIRMTKITNDLSSQVTSQEATLDETCFEVSLKAEESSQLSVTCNSRILGHKDKLGDKSSISSSKLKTLKKPKLNECNQQ